MTLEIFMEKLIDEMNMKRLSLKVFENGGIIRIIWSGKSDDRNPGIYLTPFLKNLINKASASSRALEHNFSDLNYMNSSTITPIVRMLEMAREKKIKTRVLYSKSKAWQQVSFSALSFLQTSDRTIIFEAI